MDPFLHLACPNGTPDRNGGRDVGSPNSAASLGGTAVPFADGATGLLLLPALSLPRTSSKLKFCNLFTIPPAEFLFWSQQPGTIGSKRFHHLLRTGGKPASWQLICGRRCRGKVVLQLKGGVAELSSDNSKRRSAAESRPTPFSAGTNRLSQKPGRILGACPTA